MPAGLPGKSKVSMFAAYFRAIPTPDGYATAARLLTTFGDRKQAETVRAEGRRVSAETSRPTRSYREHEVTKTPR